MEQQPNPQIIQAEPTKDFFVYMLVKDITLKRAILDLVDNCVDGAKRLRKDGKFDNLWIRLEVTSTSFKIADNCGGIPVDIARHYAFRFGRPPEMEATPNSIGQFGVGMKRSMFKMGKYYTVNSTTSNSHFNVQIDINKWKTKKEWSFEFSQLNEDTPQDLDQVGTIVTVDSLYDTVAHDFALNSFIVQLRSELELAYASFLRLGLSITLNRIPINFHHADLLTSNELKPAYWEQEIKENENVSTLNVKIIAGVANSIPTEAGWYIYCNGRLVLGPEQTIITGWGERGEVTIPRMHNQYARFRGYVFFDADDASRLPWNTTKTGVDTDSPQFKAIRQKMLNIARPIIDFLNELDKEKDTGDSQLESIVQNAQLQLVYESHSVNETRFVATPKEPKTTKPSDVTISYKRPLTEVEKVQQMLNVNSYREVGIKTFEYFVEMEGDN